MSLRSVIIVGSLAASLLAVCGCGQGTRYLIVSEVAHFEIRSGGDTLNFPAFSGGVSADEISRDVGLADHYYNKLSAIYDFKAFNFIATATSEVLYGKSSEREKPERVYGHEDSLTRVELLLTGFSKGEAHYLFRLTDRKTSRRRDYTTSVPVGMSASIGILTDPENHRGHLLAFAPKSLAITRDLKPQQLADFLKEKNTPRDADPGYYKASDQLWMDRLFGPGKMKLPVSPVSQSEGDSAGTEVLAEQRPFPLGGLQSISLRVVYPPAAIQDGVEGQVLVAVRINEQGKVSASRVVRPVRADLDSAAVRAVEGVLFTPARDRDKPISAWVMIPIRFKLG